MKKTKEQISYNMQQVKNKDSEIEILLRKALWQKGYRYRKNVSGIFGHPDIAFISKKVAIFCDSEFWHGYDWENRKVNSFLTSNGWIVIRFWGKEIKKDLQSCVQKIEETIKER